MLPTLIAETGLLSFFSRHHLGVKGGGPLREVELRETTMVRRLVVMRREGGICRLRGADWWNCLVAWIRERIEARSEAGCASTSSAVASECPTSFARQ